MTAAYPSTILCLTWDFRKKRRRQDLSIEEMTWLSTEALKDEW